MHSRAKKRQKTTNKGKTTANKYKQRQNTTTKIKNRQHKSKKATKGSRDLYIFRRFSIILTKNCKHQQNCNIFQDFVHFPIFSTTFACAPKKWSNIVDNIANSSAGICMHSLSFGRGVQICSIFLENNRNASTRTGFCFVQLMYAVLNYAETIRKLLK